MNESTLATILPTTIVAAFHLVVRATFVQVMARRRPAALPAERPTVSLLKPVAGVDDDLRENLESFAALTYPSFEVLFGVASASDPAVPVVESFLAAHPDIDARIVWTSPPSGDVLNPKVAQLIELTRSARGAVLVVSDADVRVPRSYLDALVDVLQQPGVGLVSSLVVGTGERTLGAALGNAQLGGNVAPMLVAARRLFHQAVTVGKSMAMRRADLERAGGWESVRDVLAEDEMLGRRFRGLGLGVEICLDAVENRNTTTPVARTIERHARWARMRRALVPFGFAVEPWFIPVVTAAVVALIARTALALWLVLGALALQIAGALLCHRVLGARRPLLLALLEPVRVVMALLCWTLAATSRRVSWRGHSFIVGAGSRLTRVVSQ